MFLLVAEELLWPGLRVLTWGGRGRAVELTADWSLAFFRAARALCAGVFVHSGVATSSQPLRFHSGDKSNPGDDSSGSVL